MITRQTEGPFKRWESVQEFQGDNGRTHIRHTIDYELGTLDKAGNFVTGSQADDKIRQGLEQSSSDSQTKVEDIKNHLNRKSPAMGNQINDIFEAVWNNLRNDAVYNSSYEVEKAAGLVEKT